MVRTEINHKCINFEVKIKYRQMVGTIQFMAVFPSSFCKPKD
jgi:hypothetical protein